MVEKLMEVSKMEIQAWAQVIVAVLALSKEDEAGGLFTKGNRADVLKIMEAGWAMRLFLWKGIISSSLKPSGVVSLINNWGYEGTTTGCEKDLLSHFLFFRSDDWAAFDLKDGIYMWTF